MEHAQRLGKRRVQMSWQVKRFVNFKGPSYVGVCSRICARARALICVLFCVCSPVCALITCVLLHVCSDVCSHGCAFITRVLICLCFVFPFRWVLPCVRSLVCILADVLFSMVMCVVTPTCALIFVLSCVCRQMRALHCALRCHMLLLSNACAHMCVCERSRVCAFMYAP